jgi:ATP synthase
MSLMGTSTSRNAMDNASKNAGDMIGSLQMQYNRGRQAAITNELVDIITGKYFFTLVRIAVGTVTHAFQVQALCNWQVVLGIIPCTHILKEENCLHSFYMSHGCSRDEVTFMQCRPATGS